MRSAWRFAAAAIDLALVQVPVERGLAADVGPFDGMWSVEVNCPSLGDAEGYNWSFPAEVSSGFMSGLYRSETSSAMGHITGRIRPDGEALLTMFGRTGPPQRDVAHQRSGTPFQYNVDAHFDGHSGTGKRTEWRPCALTFSKT